MTGSLDTNKTDHGAPAAIRPIRAPELWAAPYSYGSTVPPGARLIFLAGACPINPDGTTAGVGSYVAQAYKSIDNLEAALHAAGATLHDVVSARIFVASSERRDLTAAWEVVRRAFGHHEVPSTLVGVSVLGYPEQLVEIEAIAAIAAIVD